MSRETACPICRSVEEGTCFRWPAGDRDAELFKCDVCGEFEVTRSALIPLENEYPEYTRKLRVTLSHRLRQVNDEGAPSPVLTTHVLQEFISSEPSLPTPAAQATNIIRFVGERVTENMAPVQQIPLSFHASVGAPTRDFAMLVARELIGRGLLTGIDASTYSAPNEFLNLHLTLAGWEIFESERRGQTAGSYGFIALKFGDPILDPFLQTTIKPAVKSIGFDLLDLRDIARAGVIDNLLRAQIRDAAFILVDLTHDNPGAYWEAGYAEGLGKPVLYLCERAKFDASKTHFDTNHCTTVIWSTDRTEEFRQELVATLRRSLNLFAN